jgi:6-pyruvoyltetrahydropterin/6-carboxytetrahydropterin synthase
MIQITRKFEFDAGHRIPNHLSLCKNLHGHRYVLEATITGDLVSDDKASDFGMVLDFGEIKSVIKTHLIDEWDHAFLVYDGDLAVKDFLASLPNHKTIVLPVVPTAENLAKLAFEKISQIIQEKVDKRLIVKHVRLYETPNCWADFTI